MLLSISKRDNNSNGTILYNFQSVFQRNGDTGKVLRKLIIRMEIPKEQPGRPIIATRDNTDKRVTVLQISKTCRVRWGGNVCFWRSTFCVWIVVSIYVHVYAQVWWIGTRTWTTVCTRAKFISVRPVILDVMRTFERRIYEGTIKSLE